MEKLRISEVRSNFQEVLDKVHYTGGKVVIYKHHKPWVIISPVDQEDGKVGKKLQK